MPMLWVLPLGIYLLTFILTFDSERWYYRRLYAVPHTLGPRTKARTRSPEGRLSAYLLPGHRLGTYEVIALLGVGGMGQVYRARDPRLQRDIALKVLQTDDAEHRSRFAREARAVAALNHPNIVTIHSVEEVDGVPVPHHGAGARARRSTG